MGNSISPNIVLEHEDEGHYKAIIAGNLLCGRVVFKVNKPLVPPKVALVIEGKEKTTANADDSDDDSVWSDKICFFRKSIQLPTFDKVQEDGGVNEGIYVFPFEVLLPASLPSTSGYTNNSSGYEIEYTLKLKTDPKREFANKRTFFVGSKHLGDAKVPCLYQPQPIKVDKFGIIGRGFFSVGARIENTQVGRGEAINMYLACRNEATVPVERVEIKLLQEVQWNAQEQGDDSGEEVISVLEDVNVPGLHRKSVEHWKIVDLDTTEHKEATGYAIYVDLMAKENRVSMIVPTVALDSFTGLKVKVSHFLRVTLITMSTDGNPSTQIPIKIGHSRRVSGQRSLPLSSIPSLPTMPALPRVVEDDAVQMPLSEPKQSHKAHKIENVDQTYRNGVFCDSNEPTLVGLLNEMSGAVNDFDVVANKLDSIEWAVFLGDLSPDDFGSIIGNVTLEFSQTRLGVFLARQMAEGFTCEHCVAGVQNTTMPFRPNMVEALLPYCVDLLENHELIREQLSEFEQVVITQRTFDEPAGLRPVEDGHPLPVPSAAPDDRDNDYSDDPYRGINPRDEDICFSDPYHPGTKEFVEIVQKCLKQFETFAYCPPVYKAIRRKSRERRFLIKKEDSPWREATKVERIENIGQYFDQEKELYKKRMPQATKKRKSAKKAGGDWDAGDVNEWEQLREKARDNWDLAMSVHSYDAADDMDEMLSDDDPSRYDICLHKEAHPGNLALRRAIKSVLVTHVDTPWSPKVYRAVKAKLQGRRFFIWDIDDGAWRDATQTERVDYFGKLFEEQRISYKLEIKKAKRRAEASATSNVPGPRPSSSSKMKKAAKSAAAGDAANHVANGATKNGVGKRGTAGARFKQKKNASRNTESALAVHDDGTIGEGAATTVSNALVLAEDDDESSSDNDYDIRAIVLSEDTDDRGDHSRALVPSEDDGDGSRALVASDSVDRAYDDDSRALVVNEDGDRAYDEDSRALVVSEDGEGAYDEDSRALVVSEDGEGAYDDDSRALTVSHSVGKAHDDDNRALVVSEDNGGTFDNESRALVVSNGTDGQASSNSTRKKRTKEKAKKTSHKPYNDDGLVRTENTTAIKSMKHPHSKDVCFHSDDHPGTKSLVEVVERIMPDFFKTPWSPPIYKAIRRALRGRRFFVQQGKSWREANQDERLNGFEFYFELERDAYALKMKTVNQVTEMMNRMRSS